MKTLELKKDEDVAIEWRRRHLRAQRSPVYTALRTISLHQPLIGFREMPIAEEATTSSEGTRMGGGEDEVFFLRVSGTLSFPLSL